LKNPSVNKSFRVCSDHFSRVPIWAFRN